MLSTLLIWAGPAQVLFYGGIAAGMAMPAIAVAISISSIRFLPMTMAILPMIRRPGHGLPLQILAAHYMAVTVWSENLRRLPSVPRSGADGVFPRLRQCLPLARHAGDGCRLLPDGCGAAALRGGAAVPHADLLHRFGDRRGARRSGLAGHRARLCAGAAGDPRWWARASTCWPSASSAARSPSPWGGCGRRRRLGRGESGRGEPATARGRR